MNTLKVSIRMMCALWLLLLWSSQAQAGSWAVDRYVWTGNSHWSLANVQTYEAPYGTDRTYVGTVDIVMRDNRSIVPGVEFDPPYPNLAKAEWYHNWQDWDESVTYDSIPTLTGTADTSIYAVFKWHRKQIADPQNPYQATDDPTDNPPKYLFTREKATINADKTQSGDQVSGEVKSQQGLNMRLRDEDWVYYDRFGNVTTNASDATLGLNTAEVDVVRRLEVKGDEVKGPLVTFKGVATSTPPRSNVPSGGANVGISYTAAPAVMNVRVWTLYGEVGNIHGPAHDAPPSSVDNSVAIAAGGKIEDYNGQHNVWVSVTLSPPLAHQKLLPLTPLIVGPLHVKQAWRWYPIPEEGTVFPDGLIMPANSVHETNTSGTIILGTIASSDRANATYEVSVPGQPSEIGPAHYRQAWDESTEDSSSSQESHWSYNKKFDYDTDIDVAFFPFFKNSHYQTGDDPHWVRKVISVGNHTMNFMLGKIQVSGVIDQGYSYPQTWIFTSNPQDLWANQSASYNGPPVKLVTQEELDQICEPKTAMDTGVNEQGGSCYGLYKVKMRVKEPPSTLLEEHKLQIGDMTLYDAKIDQVWMKAQDNDVYEYNPSAQ